MADNGQLFNGNQPFKNGSYIYGKINKEIVPIYYTGGKSDTVQIVIDNEKREIKADLLGSVKNPINDATVSDEYTWSSEKIQQEVSDKTEIDDSSTSTNTVWSSSKTQDEISKKSQILDSTISSTTTWSSSKINQEIQDNVSATSDGQYLTSITINNTQYIVERPTSTFNALSATTATFTYAKVSEYPEEDEDVVNKEYLENELYGSYETYLLDIVDQKISDQMGTIVQDLQRLNSGVGV